MPRKFKFLYFLILIIYYCPSYSASSFDEFSLITYNILDDSSLPGQRGDDVLKTLSEKIADFIVLQEVNQHFLKRLKTHRHFEKYSIHADIRHKKISSGLVILTPTNITQHNIEMSQHYTPLSSSMGRGLLYIKIKQENEQLFCLGTVHLESMLSDTPVRIKQLQSVFHHMRYCDDIILAGDMNFGDGEEEEKYLPNDYIDVWRQLNPNKPGLTFNRETNERSDDSAFWFEDSRRLDRVYFNSPCIQAKSIQLIGNQPDKQGIMPSDHFGLFTHFIRLKNC